MVVESSHSGEESGDTKLPIDKLLIEDINDSEINNSSIVIQSIDATRSLDDHNLTSSLSHMEDRYLIETTAMMDTFVSSPPSLPPPSSPSSSSIFPHLTTSTSEPNEHSHAPSTSILRFESLPLDDVTTENESTTIEMLITASSPPHFPSISLSSPYLPGHSSDQYNTTSSPSSLYLTEKDNLSFAVHHDRGGPEEVESMPPTAHTVTMETTPDDDVIGTSVTSADPDASHQTSEALHDLTSIRDIHQLHFNEVTGDVAPTKTTQSYSPDITTPAQNTTTTITTHTANHTEGDTRRDTRLSNQTRSSKFITTSTQSSTSHDVTNVTTRLPTPGSTASKPLITQEDYSPQLPQTTSKIICNTEDGAVAKWLGFPIFWWVVVAGAFAIVLIMIISTCLCLITSKRRWRKKNKQRRGYLDDQLTSSFLQSYSNPEVTPSGRNNKTSNKLPIKPMKGHHHNYPKSNYPKSYHLGPKLLPFPADAVRLKPSASTPSSPMNSDVCKPHMVNGRGSTEICLSDKVQQKNRDTKETTFGTWRKSGVAGFGGFGVPGHKRLSEVNLNDADGGTGDEKSRKSNQDDEVFEENSSPTDQGLTTFIYTNKNNNNSNSISTFKS